MMTPQASPDSPLVSGLLNSGQGDRMAIGLSGLCLLHCAVGLALLASTTASAGLAALLLSPLVHEGALLAAMALAALLLVRGARLHGERAPLAPGIAGLTIMGMALMVGHGTGELLLTMAGAALVGAAHVMNLRARQRRLRA